MDIRVLFTRALTLGTIDGVAKYYDLVESQLQSPKEEERKRIYDTIKDGKLRQEEEIAERDLAMPEYTATYDLLLLNFFRYSCIVLLFLIVENKLREICEAAQKVKGISVPVPRPRSGVIESYKQYLEDEIRISSSNWDKIHDLNKIRNCIVHATGKATGFRDEKHLQQIAKRGIGLSISGYNDSDDDAESLYLAEGMLVLKPEFCKQAIKEVHDFFEGLCDSIPLRKLSLKKSS